MYVVCFSIVVLMTIIMNNIIIIIMLLSLSFLWLAVEAGEVFDFSSLRLDWMRLQVQYNLFIILS